MSLFSLTPSIALSTLSVPSKQNFLSPSAFPAPPASLLYARAHLLQGALQDRPPPLEEVETLDILRDMQFP